jgi:hypothetical protein
LKFGGGIELKVKKSESGFTGWKDKQDFKNKNYHSPSQNHTNQSLPAGRQVQDNWLAMLGVSYFV